MEKRRARAVRHGDEVERAGPRVVPGKYNPCEANRVAGTGSAGTAPTGDLRVGIAAWSISPGGTARAAPTVGAGCWPWGASPSPSPCRGCLLPRLSSQSWPNSDFFRWSGTWGASQQAKPRSRAHRAPPPRSPSCDFSPSRYPLPKVSLRTIHVTRTLTNAVQQSALWLAGG